jgi:hypothetical protein
MNYVDEVNKNYVEEKKKELLDMKNGLDDFCNCEDSKGTEIWDFGKDGLCQMYGSGIECPLTVMSQKHRDRAVNNCSFNNSQYSVVDLRVSYTVVEKFKEDNPDWGEGEIGMTEKELNNTYEYDEIFYDKGPGKRKEESDHDHTYQRWAPGGGVD